MLNNAGKKIILWSQFILFLGIAFSVMLGLLIIWKGAQFPSLRYTYYNMGTLYKAGYANGSLTIIAGILVMIFGSLASWFTALMLRAFGDLTADTKAIRERLEETPLETEAKTEILIEEPVEIKPEEPDTK